MLREAGAVEVHVRIASPPVRWPCFYGIDFASRAELVANGLDNEGIRRSVQADSLGYISSEGLIAATEQPRSRLCTACFSGEYPIALPEEAMVGKHLLEDVTGTPCGDSGSVLHESSGSRSGVPVPVSAVPSTRTSPGYGAEDALTRP
jgi:amidophosphoribosyltransferase